MKSQNGTNKIVQVFTIGYRIVSYSKVSSAIFGIAIQFLSIPTSAQVITRLPNTAPHGETLPTVEVMASQGREETDGTPQNGGNIFGSLTDNLRVTLDLSTRVTTQDGAKPAYQNVIGLDLHKVVSGERADWGTLNLQGYLTRIDNQLRHPPFFDGADDLEFVYRIFNFNFTRFGRGRLNVRVGHFEIPFGLEHLINTNGTLRDFMHGRNLGVKADWGTGINGIFPRWEYEVTISRGTGNRFFSGGGPYILAGRVGTPRDANLVVGISAFQGRVWNPGATRQWDARLESSAWSDFPEFGETERNSTLVRGLINRQRVGIDLQWYVRLYGLLAEVVYGQDSGPTGWRRQDVFNNLVELNRTNSDGRWTLYAQSRFFASASSNRWERTLISVGGVRYARDNHWALSMQYANDLTTSHERRGGALSSQVRYRF